MIENVHYISINELQFQTFRILGSLRIEENIFEGGGFAGEVGTGAEAGGKVTVQEGDKGGWGGRPALQEGHKVGGAEGQAVQFFKFSRYARNLKVNAKQ